MGQMIEGRWIRDQDVPTAGGGFVRPETTFRNSIDPAGPFEPEAGRYHLYVSLACPWAHRTLIMRRLKGLEPVIGLSVVHWLMGEDGWTFAPGEGVIADPVMDAQFLHQLYAAADPAFTGRCTVPVLWDRKRNAIVSNESADIIRSFNGAFSQVVPLTKDYYPPALREEIDGINRIVYETLNNGVYKAGFARTQAAYEAAVIPLFETMDALEERLSRNTFLCGKTVTEADWRLFTTLVRFDPVYNGHFKCNIRRLIEYKALWHYTRSLYGMPGIAETVDSATSSGTTT
jgi:putative glutathione S-transferase